jgi:SAM-dependent methyltransferase
MDARNLPFREDFDLIGAFDVIEHIAEDEQVLQQMHAATRAGGGLIVTVPQHAWLWSHADDYAQHKRRYSAAELATKVRAAGYEVVAMTSFVSLLLPAMYLSRLMNREARPDYDDTAELRLNRGVNFLFERVMDLERGLIKMGISFGAGGSLILVARKPD